MCSLPQRAPVLVGRRICGPPVTVEVGMLCNSVVGGKAFGKLHRIGDYPSNFERRVEIFHLRKEQVTVRPQHCRYHTEGDGYSEYHNKTSEPMWLPGGRRVTENRGFGLHCEGPDLPQDEFRLYLIDSGN